MYILDRILIETHLICVFCFCFTTQTVKLFLVRGRNTKSNNNEKIAYIRKYLIGNVLHEKYGVKFFFYSDYYRLSAGTYLGLRILIRIHLTPNHLELSIHTAIYHTLTKFPHPPTEPIK